jgi:hypothetical protein
MAGESPEKDAQRRPPTPVWVKVIGIVGLVIVLVIVIGLLTGVNHGPGMHGG